MPGGGPGNGFHIQGLQGVHVNQGGVKTPLGQHLHNLLSRINHIADRKYGHIPALIQDDSLPDFKIGYSLVDTMFSGASQADIEGALIFSRNFGQPPGFRQVGGRHYAHVGQSRH